MKYQASLQTLHIQAGAASRLITGRSCSVSPINRFDIDKDPQPQLGFTKLLEPNVLCLALIPGVDCRLQVRLLEEGSVSSAQPGIQMQAFWHEQTKLLNLSCPPKDQRCEQIILQGMVQIFSPQGVIKRKFCYTAEPISLAFGWRDSPPNFAILHV